MRKWEKLTGLIMAGSLLAASFGCGGTNEGNSRIGEQADTNADSVSEANNSGDETKNFNDEAGRDGTDNGTADTPDEIVVAFAGTGTIPKDLQMVEDAVNERIRDKINVIIDLQCYTIGDFPQQINLALTSNEQIDLLCTTPIGATFFSTMCSQNMLSPLDDLLEQYGQGILETVGEQWLASTSLDGSVYGVASYSNKAQDTFFCIRTDLVKKHGLEEAVANISSVDDITAILEALSTDDSIVAPIGGKQQIFTGTYGILYDETANTLAYDTLGAASLRVAGVKIEEDTAKIVNLYESEEYAKMLEIVKDWYDKGYIYKDAATYAESAPDLIKTNVTGCYFVDSQLGVETSQSLATGYDMTCVKVIDGLIDSNSMKKFVWGIPEVAREPEAAMRFLDLMYTDAELVNLLTWGIEGTHYVDKEDGTIGLPDGVTSETSGYYLGGLDFVFGNCYLAKVWEGNDPELREKSRAEMERHKMSPIAGFSVDTSALENEITAITNTVNEFRPALECGMGDSQADLKAFVEKLKSSGCDTYIREIQRQLDEFLEG